MDPLLVFPNPPPPELAQCLDLDGWSWKAVGDAEAAMAEEPEEGWSGAVVVADSDPEGAFALCRRLRKVEVPNPTPAGTGGWKPIGRPGTQRRPVR
ncbi:MAG: hypothetical protein CM1200mP26_03020 [Acidimicrobiales bacterium]|nr:MAG: hypothetical protein CM1200mP26_03020 [Acidimicrobiales bacterium]